MNPLSPSATWTLSPAPVWTQTPAIFKDPFSPLMGPPPLRVLAPRHLLIHPLHLKKRSAWWTLSRSASARTLSWWLIAKEKVFLRWATADRGSCSPGCSARQERRPPEYGVEAAWCVNRKLHSEINTLSWMVHVKSSFFLSRTPFGQFMHINPVLIITSWKVACFYCEHRACGTSWGICESVIRIDWNVWADSCEEEGHEGARPAQKSACLGRRKFTAGLNSFLFLFCFLLRVFSETQSGC